MLYLVVITDALHSFVLNAESICSNKDRDIRYMPGESCATDTLVLHSERDIIS